YVVPGGIPSSFQQVATEGLLIGLQTLVTGGFGFLGMKMRSEYDRRKQLVADREQALEENAGLHVRLLTQAREAGTLGERGRMAREIHDTLAQGLTGIITQLEAARQARDRSGREWQ